MLNKIHFKFNNNFFKSDIYKIIHSIGLLIVNGRLDIYGERDIKFSAFLCVTLNSLILYRPV